MPTVVDSLIVTLGLDPSSFNQGQKEAADQWVKTRDGAVKMGKETEQAAKNATEFLSKMRGQVLLLFAAFTGGRGVQQFTDEINRMNVAVGRAAFFLGSTVRDLSTWRGLGEATGGSVEGITGSIQGLNRSLQQLSLTGESSIVPYLRALQAFAPNVDLNLANANGEIKTAIELLPQLHKAFQGMDRARAEAIGAGMGLGQDLMFVLLQDDAAFRRMMEDQQKWGVQTESQTKASQALLYSWTGVLKSFQSIWRIVMERVTPAFIKLNEIITKFFTYMQKHPVVLEGMFAALSVAAAGFVAILAGPVISTVISGLAAIGAVLGVSAGAVVAIIAAIAAAVAAGLLLYEDFKVWSEGGQAQFGALWQYMADKWASWKGTLLPIFKGVTDLFKDTINIMVGVFRLLWAALTGTSGDIRREWRSLVGDMGKWWTDLWEGLATAVLNAAPRIFEAVKKAFGVAFDWAINRANVIWNAITGHDLINKANDAAASGSAPSPTGSNAPAQQGVDSSGRPVFPSGPNPNPNNIGNVRPFDGSGGFQQPGTFQEGVQLSAYNVSKYPAAFNGGKQMSISEIAAHWAPAKDGNNVNIWARNVSAGSGLAVDAPLDLSNPQIMAQLMRGIHSAEWMGAKNGLPIMAVSEYLAVLRAKPPVPATASSTGAAVKAALTPAPSGGAAFPNGAYAGAAVSPEGLVQNNQETSVSHEVNIGTVNVHTQATDATGLAQGLKPALDTQTYIQSANSGLE